MLVSFFFSVSRITLLADLDAFFHSSRRPLPLLVRILHRSRIRYYGKPGQNIDFPFQVSWGHTVGHIVLFVCSYWLFQRCQTYYLFSLPLSFAPSFFHSFRCTVRWLIRVASCLWLYGMIFVLSGSTDWQLAQFYIYSSTRWNTVIRSALDHKSTHSLLWLSTPLVWTPELFPKLAFLCKYFSWVCIIQVQYWTI